MKILFQILVIISVIQLSVCLTPFQKKDLDALIQTTDGNELLDSIKIQLNQNKGKNYILDTLDQQAQSLAQIIRKDQEEFAKQENDCLRQIQSSKQEVTNKKSEKDVLEQKPDRYRNEIKYIDNIIQSKQELIGKKEAIVDELKENRTFIFNAYLKIYDSYGDTEKFLIDLQSKLTEMANMLKGTTNLDKLSALSEQVQSLLKQNQKIDHPYVPLIESLSAFFGKGADSLDLDDVKKILNIVANLLEDVNGTEEGFDELEKIRSKNFKDEIDRLNQEVEAARNTVVQLQEYQQSLNQKLDKIQVSIKSIDNYLDNSDSEMMSQKAHCEGEQSRFMQKEREKETQFNMFKKMIELLEYDYDETTNYISKMDIKLYNFGY